MALAQIATLYASPMEPSVGGGPNLASTQFEFLEEGQREKNVMLMDSSQPKPKPQRSRPKANAREVGVGTIKKDNIGREWISTEIYVWGRHRKRVIWMLVRSGLETDGFDILVEEDGMALEGLSVQLVTPTPVAPPRIPDRTQTIVETGSALVMAGAVGAWVGATRLYNVAIATAARRVQAYHRWSESKYIENIELTTMNSSDSL